MSNARENYGHFNLSNISAYKGLLVIGANEEVRGKKGCNIWYLCYHIAHNISNSISDKITTEVMDSCQMVAAANRWEHIVLSKPHSNLPWYTAAGNFRMGTGQGRHHLQSHSYKIGVVDLPTCPLCFQEEGTADHLLHSTGLHSSIETPWKEGRIRIWWPKAK